MLPECLDDWIDESNPVRALDAFVVGRKYLGPKNPEGPRDLTGGSKVAPHRRPN